MIVHQKAKREFLLQAYLAVSPSNPKWSGIEFTAIEGWQKYQWWDGGNYHRDPRLTEEYSKWSFVSEEAAHEVLSELLAIGQRYWLRIIKREAVIVDSQLGGYSIPNGTIVKKPDGSVPVFMGKPVEGCKDDLPELFC